MTNTPFARPLFALIVAAVTTAASADTKPDSLIDRGRYIVDGIAGCNDCHTPHNEKGGLVEGMLLTGQKLPFAPTIPMPWAPAAPSIAGLPTYTTEQAVKFLMTGERPSGVPTLPPMPPYRLNEEDAKAVVAYIKSLPATPKPVPAKTE